MTNEAMSVAHNRKFAGAPGRVRTFYGADFVKGVPQGSYPFSYPSVSLFDRGSGLFAPIHTPSGRRAQERSRLGPAHWAATDRLGLDGFEQHRILFLVGRPPVA